MMRITAILAALMVCATAASAAPMVVGIDDGGSGPKTDVTNFQLIADYEGQGFDALTMDLVLADATGLPAVTPMDDIIGVAAGITLEGTAATLFDNSSVAANRAATPIWTNRIQGDGLTYMMSGLANMATFEFVTSTSAAVNDNRGLTHGFVSDIQDSASDSLLGVDFVEGAVMARFIFANVGGATEADLDNLVVRLHADDGILDSTGAGKDDWATRQPYLVYEDSGNQLLDVVPEPATMGLLGLGLLGVLARRKK